MRVPGRLLAGALGLLLLAIQWLRRLRAAATRKGGNGMVQAMVHGIALFHVEDRHPADDDHHALILKLRQLRALRLDHAAIGQIRPIYRVYSTPGERTCGPWQYLIELTADSQRDLANAFREIDDRVNCHMDGFGF